MSVTQKEQIERPAAAIVMAAGFGTRMKSKTPKVLHQLAGRPLVYYPVQAALALGVPRVVLVVNPDTHEPIAEELARHFDRARLQFAIQQVPRGTGDAVSAGLRDLDVPDEQAVLILSGDTPLLTAADLEPLLGASESAPLRLLSFVVDEPRGYGRIVREEDGRVARITEDRDLKDERERAIREVNAGVYACRAGELRRALPALVPHNAQGEYYLTDIVAEIGARARVEALVSDARAFLGVNDRAELAACEALLHDRIRKRLARDGITIRGTPLIDDTVEVGPDATIEDGVRLRGKTRIGSSSTVDVGSVLTDAEVGEGVLIRPYTIIEKSRVGAGAVLGPFTHVRPGSEIGEEAHLGNFVETKQTKVGARAKANHLSYLGDADVGPGANIGAGTIVCNYDGFSKSRTKIGARTFVGSDCQLVAPVEIGSDVYVATGTTVTEDVPDGAFVIGRSRQTTKEGYAEALRVRLKAQKDAKAASSK
ncbi:MAG: UDP-N-acetylglucosamine diphosphorylase/glucosamine-1-phosphate N-acetyltransferase [Sorangiineae bacterium NIC37A_2]|jgi:bifunctional UDP-N-acetylglucosamine pyrophosphorylase/glucosamine-1-phosphate N-acetyltransferase|nr:MAG: UDP-N-acetylglucosamine diphosphorylase/glucosamine-1-phosphate N-acetyltransferase [Sorangiineae bacterium NIC37A_2]